MCNKAFRSANACSRRLVELHHRQHRLTELPVGEPDHRNIDHIGVQCQAVLDLLRVDVDSARDDRERLAVPQEQVPVLVHEADVATSRPGRVDRMPSRVGLSRITVVREGHRLALEVHQTRLTGWCFVAVVVTDAQHTELGGADRAGTLQPRGRRDHRDPVGRRRGVVLVQYRSEPVQHLLLHLDGTGSGGVDHISL